MSGGIDIDVELLTAFLGELKRFNRELFESMERCNTQFASLSDGWQDERFRKFSDDWAEAAAAISKYLGDSVGQIAVLEDKAAAARAYLGGAW